LQEFFTEKVGFGRYASKSVGEIFIYDRRYFDQVLHRNASFRNRYSKAYKEWISNLGKVGTDPEEIRRERIMEAVAIIGDQNVQGLFKGLLDYINSISSSCFLSTVSFKETLSNSPPPELRNHLETITRFWARIALPEA
jgi:hypothetical protein